LEEISHAKGRATSSEDDTGIRRTKAGPGRWEYPDVLRRVVKCDAVLSPIVAVGEDFKLLAVQRMKRMGNREKSFCKRWRRCS
jgi:hypothetical protein